MTIPSEGSEVLRMWTPGRVIELLKRYFEHWEPIGEWDGSSWRFSREHSEGLSDWLFQQERKDPEVWRMAVEEQRRFRIHGEHFDYRVTPRGERLVVERKPK